MPVDGRELPGPDGNCRKSCRPPVEGRWLGRVPVEGLDGVPGRGGVPGRVDGVLGLVLGREGVLGLVLGREGALGLVLGREGTLGLVLGRDGVLGLVLGRVDGREGEGRLIDGDRFVDEPRLTDGDRLTEGREPPDGRAPPPRPPPPRPPRCARRSPAIKPITAATTAIRNRCFFISRIPRIGMFSVGGAVSHPRREQRLLREYSAGDRLRSHG